MLRDLARLIVALGLIGCVAAPTSDEESGTGRGSPAGGPIPVECPPGRTAFYGRCVKPFGLFGQHSFREASRDTVTGHAVYHAAGVLVDTGRTPNAVYIVDTGNNRILGFHHLGSCESSAAACTTDEDCPGSTCIVNRDRDADLIFGQPDAESAACNHDANVGLFASPGADTLCLTHFPIGTNVAEQWGKFNPDLDADGNLYVPDAYNNRILRFDAPLATGPPPQGDTIADFVWGQSDFVSNEVNHGLGAAGRDASSLWIAGTAVIGSVTFAPETSLGGPAAIWVADSSNRRLLRFPVDSGTPGTADLVLGQVDFTSLDVTDCVPPGPTAHELDKLCNPSHARLDPDTGQLWVIDETDQPGPGRPFAARILVFEPPFTNGMAASRMIMPPTLPYPGYFQATGLQLNPFHDGSYAPGHIWINELEAYRALLLAADGGVVAIVGATGPDQRGGDSQYQPPCGSIYEKPSLWVPGGSVGFDDADNLYLADDKFHQVARYGLPYELVDVGGTLCLPDPDANLLRGGLLPNDVGPSKFSEVVGVTTFHAPGTEQLVLHDHARYMVWNDYAELPIGAPADVIVGEPAPDTRDFNPFGILSRSFFAVDHRGRLWAGKEHGQIIVFQLPLENGSQPIATDIPLVWHDDSTPVTPFSTVSLAFDAVTTTLWVVDNGGNRVMRLRNFDRVETFDDMEPPGKLRVDRVIGQGDKTTLACNRGRGEGEPDAYSLCGAYQARFDRLGHLYVVENSYECQGNNRITVFDHQDLASATDLFPEIAARRVFNARFDSDFTAPKTCGAPFYDRPFSPVTVAFNSRNEMVIGNDGYYPDPAQRVWRQLYFYRDPVARQRPDAAILLPVGAVGDVHFDADDRLIVQDHTWPRIWVIDLEEKDVRGRRVWLERLGISKP